MKKIGLIFISILFAQVSNASHLAGGEIWYQHISDSTYKVNYRMYRDCYGLLAPSSSILRYRSISIGLDSSINMPKDTFYNNNTCLDNSCENINSPRLGIQVHEYSALVIFSPASDWEMEVTHGARNPCDNLNVGNLDLYVQATLNNSAGPNNSTVPFAAINMRQSSLVSSNFNFPMLEPDGDYLEIEFVNPLSSGTSAFTPQLLPYINGATINNPFNSTPAPSLNSATGNISLFPCLQGDYNFAILIKEFRNNVLVGTAMRDYLFSFVPDTNLPPYLTGMNNTFVFDTTVVVCPSNQLYFDVHSADSNLSDSTFVFCTSKPAGATFNVNPSQNQIGNFSWTPTLADVRTQPYILAFRVKDNQCAEQSYGYRVYVEQCTNLSIQEKEKDFRVQVYPNPSSLDMTISLDLEKRQFFKVVLYDLSGRVINDNIFTGELQSGKHEIPLSLIDNALGHYQLEISSRNNKMILPIQKF